MLLNPMFRKGWLAGELKCTRDRLAGEVLKIFRIQYVVPCIVWVWEMLVEVGIVYLKICIKVVA